VAIVEDELSLVFSALADPTRRAILERLAHGDATVNQLAEPFAMTQQAVSKHLKVLERARLISRTRTGQSRPSVLDTEHLDAAAGWIARHRQIWADRHDRLDEHLPRVLASERTCGKGGFKRAGGRTAPTALSDPGPPSVRRSWWCETGAGCGIEEFCDHE
jgi:DNA-binding transcriptional ArsR family regulator